MSRICRRVQDILGAAGPAGLQDHEAMQHHLEGCDECFAALESVSQLDQAFAAMPELDAPDALVEALLDRDELQEPPRATEAPAKPGWRLWRRDLREDLLRLLGPGELRLKAAAALVLIAALSPLLYFRV
ncbi:MAG: hypothetical protein AAF657_40060, partial [Acidobacteriota bacterium]